jgi:hypothetical protein
MAEIVVVTVAFGLSVWVLDSGLDLLWAWYGGVLAVPMATADALVAMAFAVVVLKLMLLQRARHRKVVHQLKTVAEMNHHIRNALQSIVYVNSKMPEQDAVVVREATRRIEWALTEILPRHGDSKKAPAAASKPTSLR